MDLNPKPTIVDMLRDHAGKTPGQLAFQFLANGETETTSVTFAALERRTMAIAAELQERKLGPRVVLMFQPGLSFVATFFGCLAAGLVAVPVYPPKRREECAHLRNILQAAEASLLVCDPPSAALLARFVQAGEAPMQPVPMVIDWQEDESAVAERAASFRPPDVQADDTAFLQFTSGSTGQPKGVIISHANIMANQQVIQRAFGHDASTKVLGWLPFYHDMGLLGILMQPVYLGRPCVLMPPAAFIQKPLRWLKAIAKYGISTSGGPNFAYELCVKSISDEQLQAHPELDLSSWQLAFSGAEPVRAETLARFAAKFAAYGFSSRAFYPCYGMAETTLLLTGIEKQASPQVATLDAQALETGHARDANSNASIRHAVSCGRVWGEHGVVIIDPDSGAALPENAVGEIWASGPSVAQGYWNRPQATRENFQLTHPNYPGRHFLRTGDLGFLREGNLYVTGRLKTLLIVNGKKYYPHDIEATVTPLHPAFRSQTAIFSDEDRVPPRIILVQEVYTHLAKKIDLGNTIKQIQSHVLGQHGIKLDEVILTSDRIPVTSSGKTRHAECRHTWRKGQLRIIGDNSTQSAGAEALE